MANRKRQLEGDEVIVSKRHQSIKTAHSKGQEFISNSEISTIPSQEGVDMFLNSPINEQKSSAEKQIDEKSTTGADRSNQTKHSDMQDMFSDTPIKCSDVQDMFSDTPIKDDKSSDVQDMFSDTPIKDEPLRSVPISEKDNSDNWHDQDFYYKVRVGEIIKGKYKVKGVVGSGVYSTVVLATNLQPSSDEPLEVAIKIPRNNDIMLNSAKSELQMLKQVKGQNYCVRLVDSFEYRRHLCLVMEPLDMNLRKLTEKYGRNIGINLKTIRLYAYQLLAALRHLTECGVLHLDIKPDNIVVNKDRNVIKLCDFGVAMPVSEINNMVTQELVSRYYRAPEIVLGCTPYGHAVDMWSAGCCLYELYTNRILFKGGTNNELLKLHMELKGPFSKGMLRRGAFTGHFFNQNMDFLMPGQLPKTMSSLVKKTNVIAELEAEGSSEERLLLPKFKDLLERMLILDPSKRITPQEALNHPFIKGKTEQKQRAPQVVHDVRQSTLFCPRMVKV